MGETANQQHDAITPRKYGFKKSRANFKPADHYESRFKPVIVEGQRKEMQCLGTDCEVWFTADPKKNRLCETCRRKD